MISFVLPVYNSAPFLADTIESLLAQKVEKEIIVIDDGSTDDISFLRDHYTDNVQDIKWIHRAERSGAASCRNIGNMEAKGDIIAVCDAGDYCMPNRGTEIELYFKEHPEIDIVYSHVQVNSPTGKVLYIQEADDWEEEGKPPISHPTVAYRNCVVSGVKMMDETDDNETFKSELRDRIKYHEDSVDTNFYEFFMLDARKAELRDRIKYHEDSVDTDFYEFFMLDARKAGYEFGYIESVLVVKIDLGGATSYRDVPKSKREKAEKYKEYGLKVANV